ncbi:MAG: insulinase family protein, partial [Chlamydiae bacterium]|nr:insulinase family protein [Chlamydiota bacterium]
MPFLNFLKGKIMAFLLFFVFLFRSIVCFGSLPEDGIDQQIKVGKLDNGMAYYIRENAYPEEMASLRLVIDVGSMHETKEERGIAHFVEHMVFRGSDHFKDGEAVRYLESIGAWFGPDTNAYTSLDSTIYKLDIPINSPDALEKAILILSDFAFKASMRDEEINKERDVILDELHRDSSNSQYRLFEKIVQFFFSSAPFAQLPGGSKEVIQNSSSELVRNFYKKWYRPNHMAIIAVGDFKEKNVFGLIKKYFSDFPCDEKEDLKPVIDKPSLDSIFSFNPSCLIHFDPELQFSEVALISFLKAEPMKNSEQLNEKFISNVIAALLNNRLDKLSHIPTASFLGGHAHFSKFSHQLSLFSIGATLYEDRVFEGMEALKTAFQEILERGFTENEWEKVKSALKKKYLKKRANVNKIKHKSHVSSCMSHFLTKQPLLSWEYYLEKKLELIDTITINEINQSLSSSPLNENFLVLFATPSKKVEESVNQELLLNFFQEKKELTNPHFTQLERTLRIEPKFSKGAVLDKRYDADLGVTYLTLNNGIEIVLKPTELKKEQIILSAYAKGGISSFSEEELVSGNLSLTYRILSGLGGLSYNETADFFEEKGIDSDLRLEDTFRIIQLQSSPAQTESLFQLFHEFFSPPFFDPAQWEFVVKRQKEVIKQCLNDPKDAFGQFVLKTNLQTDYFSRFLDIKRANEKLAREIFSLCFGNPKDFLFTIVGDFNIDEVIPYIETYLASLPVKDEPFPIIKNFVSFPKETLHEEFKFGNRDHANTLITIPFDMKNVCKISNDNDYAIRAVALILHQRIRKLIIEEYSISYSTFASIFRPFFPDDHYTAMQIGFTSQPDERKKITELVLQELKKMKESPPTQEEINTIKEQFKREKNEFTLSNFYWIRAIEQA